MATLVLTVIGDDRAGLVSALAEVIARHHGSWSRSELAELAGKFAGIVEVAVDDDRVDELTAALRPLDGLLDVTAHSATGASRRPGQALTIDLVGNDRRGIVQEISAALRDHGVTIDRLTSEVDDAPMGGGRLFRATVHAHADAEADLAATQEALERIAGELMVDLELTRAAD